MIDYLTLCEQAARAGGDVLLSWVGRFQVQEKGPSDLVTEADLAAQKAIAEILLSACPNHHLIGEESPGPVEFKSEFCWVVDPLDGTTNYVHQVPHYAVSIALTQHGRPVVGVVYDPVHKECFSAARGKGAWLDGVPIRVSGQTDLSQALVAASFSAKVRAPSPEIDQFVAMLLACQAVRRTGSAALNLCYVACGRFDAFWALTTKAWDIAAGMLIVEEAGGVLSLVDGGALDLQTPHPVASASVALHEQFRRGLWEAGRAK